jgi:hypothetical protein
VKPRVFWLHVHHFDAARGRVWAVQTGGKYLTAAQIDVRVPLATVFRGRRARQPRAYLRGRGVIRRRAGVLMIQEA